MSPNDPNRGGKGGGPPDENTAERQAFMDSIKREVGQKRSSTGAGGPPPGGAKPPAGAPMKELSTAEKAAKFGPTREAAERFEALIRAEVRRRQMLKKGAKYAGYAAGAAVAIWLIVVLARRPDPKGCFANEVREDAYRALTTQGDTAAASTLRSRFDKKSFRCAEVADPKGTLVAVREDSGDPIIWFVNGRGTAYNVNLLSAAWTPRLPGGPAFTDAQLATVSK